MNITIIIYVGVQLISNAFFGWGTQGPPDPRGPHCVAGYAGAVVTLVCRGTVCGRVVPSLRHSPGVSVILDGAM